MRLRFADLMSIRYIKLVEIRRNGEQYTHVHTNISRHTHTLTLSHTHTHTYIHTYTHAHTPDRNS